MPADARAMESLLAFWADSGVEVSYADAPVDRMAAGLAALQPKRAAVRGVAPAPSAPTPIRAETEAGLVDARRLAAAAPDLAALEAAIRDFEGCPLRYEGARQAVFARGDPAAPVMIVGEGPGGDEDAQGAPFVGRAGKLLDKMLAAAGLEGRVFITNTVFWRPPGNRTPTAAEQLVCAPFLERAVELVKPRVLLLLGGAAAKHLLNRSEGNFPCADGGLSGAPATSAWRFPPCRRFTPPSCCANPRPRRRPGKTF